MAVDACAHPGGDAAALRGRCPSVTSSRIEFVPKSTAATFTLSGAARAIGHPAPDRVVAAGEEPGVVGVQALHPSPGPADTAGRPGPA